MNALSGRRILVTRPRELAQGLAELIAGAGGKPVLFPAIEILGLEDARPVRALLARAAEFDFAIFVSPSAVRMAFALHAGPWPERVAALGAGTRRELEARGVRGVLAPQEGADSEALLALAPLRQVADARVLILRGAGGRELIAETLGARGARVEVLECYRRARPAGASLPEGVLDAVCANSIESLENLAALLGLERLRRAPLFVPHERVAQRARDMGLAAVEVAGPGDAQILACLLAYFGAAK